MKALLDEAEGRGRPLRRLVRLVVDWAKQRLLCHDAQNKKHSRLITMKTVHWTLLVWAAVCGPLASQSSETVRDREFDWHSQSFAEALEGDSQTCDDLSETVVYTAPLCVDALGDDRQLPRGRETSTWGTFVEAERLWDARPPELSLNARALEPPGPPSGGPPDPPGKPSAPPLSGAPPGPPPGEPSAVIVPPGPPPDPPLRTPPVGAPLSVLFAHVLRVIAAYPFETQGLMVPMTFDDPYWFERDCGVGPKSYDEDLVVICDHEGHNMASRYIVQDINIHGGLPRLRRELQEAADAIENDGPAKKQFWATVESKWRNQSKKRSAHAEASVLLPWWNMPSTVANVVSVRPPGRQVQEVEDLVNKLAPFGELRPWEDDGSSELWAYCTLCNKWAVDSHISGARHLSARAKSSWPRDPEDPRALEDKATSSRAQACVPREAEKSLPAQVPPPPPPPYPPPGHCAPPLSSASVTDPLSKLPPFCELRRRKCCGFVTWAAYCRKCEVWADDDHMDHSFHDGTQRSLEKSFPICPTCHYPQDASHVCVLREFPPRVGLEPLGWGH